MEKKRLERAIHGLCCAGLMSALAACQTIDPYTGETKTSNATRGAAIGAAAGALVGAISGDNNKERRKNAAIGAGIGALAGAGVGHYMDLQEAKLREQLAGTGVSVTRVGDNGHSFSARRPTDSRVDRDGRVQ